MNPSYENMAVVLDESLSIAQKLEFLSTIDHPESTLDCLERLQNLIERAKTLASEVNDGINHQSNVGRSKANFEAAPLKIADTPRGDLTLSFFIYRPENAGWGQSINASWHLKKGKESTLVLREYLSNRSFTADTAAFEPNGSKLLDLLGESLDEYERVRALRPDADARSLL